MEIKQVNIFNNIVPIKGYICNKSGDCNITKPDFMHSSVWSIDYGANLYIYIQGACNAYCKFCNIHREKNEPFMDFDALEKTLKELKSKITIPRIGITGGEPFLDLERLDNTITCVRKYFPDANLTVHTNGAFLDKIDQLKGLEHLNEVHISRHHYNDKINDEVFHAHTSNEDDIRRASQILKDRIYLNCVLVKNYIDNEEEIKKYLEWVLSCNVHYAAFVDLTSLNNYCEEKFVDIFKMNLSDDFNTYEHLKNIDICSCFKGKYISPNSQKTVNLFFRQTKSWPTKCYHYLEFKNNKLFAGEKEISN